MARRGISVLFAACLVVAGLGSAVGGGGAVVADSTEQSDFGGCAPLNAAERTHEGVPSATNESAVRSVAASWYPPGVSASGVENASRLIEAHRRATNRSGFVAEFNSTFTDDDRPETTAVGGDRYLATENLTRVFQRSWNATGNVTFELWANETRVFGWSWHRGLAGTWKDYDVGPSDGIRFVHGIHPVENDVRNGDFNVTRVTGWNGRTVFVLRSERIDYGSFGDPHDWEYDATLVVDSSGRVHYFRSYRHSLKPNDNRTFRMAFRLCALDPAPPKRPDWIANIPPEADADVSPSTDDVWQRYIRLGNGGPDPLPATTVVAVRSNGTVYKVGLERPLPEGETRYVYLLDGTLRVSGNRSLAARKGKCLGDTIWTEVYTETGTWYSTSGGSADWPCKSAANITTTPGS